VYQNILIIQTAFIGDAILASSLVEKLSQTFPQAKISILVRKGNEAIYARHPRLHQVLVWNKKEKKMRHLFGLLSEIRNQKFDCVINCHRFASSGFLTAFSGAKHTAGYKQNPFSFLFDHAVKHSLSNGEHEIERYQALISDFTEGTASKPRLYPSAEDREKVAAYQNSTYVCFAPASVWFTKQLPIEKWIDLSAQITSDKTIYLVGAPSDKALCEQIVSAAKHSKIINLAGTLSLLESTALFAKAVMTYVNDSAPLHLCSSVNAPVTAFFCSTVPEFGFGPLSDQAQLKQVSGLACRPCGVHGYKSCPLHHFKCGHQINLDQLN
jgi:heptosyltransferase-2